MCLNKSKTKSCLCHLIRPILLSDKAKNVRTTYFTPMSIVELYDFLLEAYALVDLTIKASEVDNKLKQLVSTYLLVDSAQSINVNDEENRLAFFLAYTQYTDKQIQKGALYEKLDALINDVHKLIYNNLSDNPGFNELLSNMNKKHERRHSLTFMPSPNDSKPKKQPDNPGPKDTNSDVTSTKGATKEESSGCSIM